MREEFDAFLSLPPAVRQERQAAVWTRLGIRAAGHHARPLTPRTIRSHRRARGSPSCHGIGKSDTRERAGRVKAR
jgi:hypothetical protein